MIPDSIRGEVLREALFGLGILAASFVITVIVSRIVMPILGKITSSTKTQLDNYLLIAIKSPLRAVIMVLGAYIAVTALSVTNAYQGYINTGWRAVMLAVIFWGLQRVTAALLNWYGAEVSRTQADWDKQFLPVIRRTVTGAILAIGVLVILAELGFQISPLLAGLGIGGLAIALALQPTLSNFFAGTYVLSDGSIRAGDYVEVQGGPAGTIMEVGWRVTKILSPDNNVVSIPNSKLSDSVITNFSQPEPSMNMVLACGVSYQSDLVGVEQVCLEVMQDLRERLPEADKSFTPVVRFTEYAESNINLNLVMGGIDRGATFFLRHELIKALHERFGQEGIEMNYPVRKLIYPTNGQATSLGQGRSTTAQSRSRGLYDTDGSESLPDGS